MKGMGNMMKQAQKLQAKMLRMQEELAEKTVESTAGGGMVKVVANGKQQIVSIQIERKWSIRMTSICFRISSWPPSTTP